MKLLRDDDEAQFELRWAAYLDELDSKFGRFFMIYSGGYPALMLENFTGVGHLLTHAEQEGFMRAVLEDKRFLARQVNPGSLLATVTRLSAPGEGLAAYGTTPEMIFAALVATAVASERYPPSRAFNASVRFERAADAEARKYV